MKNVITATPKEDAEQRTRLLSALRHLRQATEEINERLTQSPFCLHNIRQALGAAVCASHDLADCEREADDMRNRQLELEGLKPVEPVRQYEFAGV